MWSRVADYVRCPADEPPKNLPPRRPNRASSLKHQAEAITVPRRQQGTMIGAIMIVTGWRAGAVLDDRCNPGRA
jgi:hypothetical protein